MLNRGEVQTQEPKITQSGEEGALGDVILRFPDGIWLFAFLWLFPSIYFLNYIQFTLTDLLSLPLWVFMWTQISIPSPPGMGEFTVKKEYWFDSGLQLHGEALSIDMALVGARPMYTLLIPE